jgi:hypothetical protein
MLLKKLSQVFMLLLGCLCYTSCANRTVYLANPPEINWWCYATGIAILITLIYYAYLLVCIYKKTTNQGQEKILNIIIYQGFYIFLSIVVFPFLIFGEWFFEFFLWLLAQGMVAKILLCIATFFISFKKGISQSVAIWCINYFFWHISDLYIFYALPALLGGIISEIPTLWLLKVDGRFKFETQFYF